MNSRLNSQLVFELFSYFCLKLSHNQIFGEVPDTLPFTGSPTIYLGSNNLKGSLPRISSSLVVLDLSYNFFSGEISCLLCHPTEIGKMFTIFHLGRNVLSREIPDCWMHWTSLKMIELGSNNLTGEISNSVGSLLRLHSMHICNKYHLRRNPSLSSKLYKAKSS